MPRTRNPLLAPDLRWTTVGSIALIFLGAFESLAVTTIMPIVSKELDGKELYSLAFAGFLAASIIGTVIAGGWADRRGPSQPLIVAMVVFLVGLVLSGTAETMGMFIAGRLLQGLGSGAINVALYVVVGRLYAPELHPKIFGAFAAAWVLPSMIGPPVAGFVAERISWHWVFIGVAALVVGASFFIVPALRTLHAMTTARSADARVGWAPLWAVLMAAGVVTISLGGEMFGWPLAVAGLVVVVFALRPLVPAGTFLVRRGLPAAVLLRGAIAAAFFGTEIYLPYLLHEEYGFDSSLSGLILTVGAVSWAIGSAVQGRLGERMSHDTTLRIGAVILTAGIGAQLVTALWLLSPVVAAAGWFVAGAGMGLLFPRISTIVLAHSSVGNQGFNTSAMSIADNAGSSTVIAFAGLAFTASSNGFAAALAITTVVVALAIPLAFRVRTPMVV